VLGALLWCLCLPVVIGWGRRFVRPSIFRWVNALCGLLLGYFSLTLFWDTVHAFLEHPPSAVSLVGRVVRDAIRGRTEDGIIERVLTIHEPFRSTG
jgi:hypothetical protein